MREEAKPAEMGHSDAAAELHSMCERAKAQLASGACCAPPQDGVSAARCTRLRALVAAQQAGSSARTCDLLRVLPAPRPPEDLVEAPWRHATFPPRLYDCEAGPHAQTFSEEYEWRSVCLYRGIDTTAQRATRLTEQAKELSIEIQGLLGEGAMYEARGS